MIEFKINNDLAQVTTRNDDGTVTHKSVATADLLTLFAKQAKSSDIIVPAGARQVIERNNHIAYVFITPAYSGNIILGWHEGDEKKYGKFSEYIPETKVAADYQVKSTRVFPIPFPATAVLVDFVKTGIPGELQFSNMWCWALKDTVTPYNDLTAYRWPFTNVYAHHRVCIGNVPDRIKHIDAANAYVRYLYNGLGNHDLDGNAKYSPKDHGLGVITTPYQMITSIIKAPSFPVDYLNPVGSLRSVVQTALSGN